MELRAIESEIAGTCIDHLKSGRLVAYGCGSSSEIPSRVGSELWRLLTNVDWERSSAEDQSAEKLRLQGIRVYAPLLAPCRAELLDGLPLIEAFRSFVLGDPEVAQLGKEAVRMAPKFSNMFRQGSFGPYDHPRWPLAFERWTIRTTIHPDPAKRSVFDRPEPDPLEAVIAAEAWTHRYCALITSLRTGEVQARGIAGITGPSDLIPRSIWSHEDFEFDSSTANILQDNPHSTDRYDAYVKRWIGVALENPERVARGVPANLAGAGMSFAKPTEFEGSPSATAQTDRRVPRKGVARAEANINDASACRKWLIELMRQRPDERTTNKILWAEAKERWPGLSENSFKIARAKAIQEAGAARWATAGAPKKSRS